MMMRVNENKIQSRFARWSKVGLTSVLVGALWLGVGCGAHSGKPPQGSGPRPAVPVLLAQSETTNFPVQLTAIGTVKPYATVSVRPRVDGQLGTVLFEEGQAVKKGDLIFQIEPKAFEVALKQAQAVLARDEASLQSAQLDMKRTDELAGTKAVSASIVDANRAKVASLQATVEADKASVEIATVQLSYCSIRSSIDGRVGFMLVHAGNVIKNNDSILAVINQTKPIYVDFAIPQSALPDVRTSRQQSSLQVEARMPSDPNRSIVGRLETINNEVDTTTGTVLLRASFANGDEFLWPGQFVNVVLTLGTLPNAVVVPSAAIQTSQNGEFVFAVKPDMSVEKRMVKLGPSRGGRTVIQSGVDAGQTVVTDGQMRLVPGSTVRTNSVEARPTPATGGSKPS